MRLIFDEFQDQKLVVMMCQFLRRHLYASYDISDLNLITIKKNMVDVFGMNTGCLYVV